MIKVFVTMFSPDWTWLDGTSFYTDQATTDDPTAIAAVARIVGGQLKRPVGMRDVHVILTTGRPATSEEAKSQREGKGPDSEWFV